MKLSCLLFSLILHLLTGCGPAKKEDPNKLLLPPGYAEINDIRSFARCKGPQGNYTTSVHSASDGSCTFTQEYEYRPLPFLASLTADNRGYVIDSNQRITDTLPNDAVEMIRSHEFHRMHSNPAHFFRSLVFEKDMDKTTAQFRASDRLGYPVHIYYNRHDKLISRVEMLNPADTGQAIEIIFKSWTNSAYGKLVKELEIIQAKKDSFYFDFTSVLINQKN